MADPLHRFLADPATRTSLDAYLERERRGELGPGIPHEDAGRLLGLLDDDQDDGLAPAHPSRPRFKLVAAHEADGPHALFPDLTDGPALCGQPPVTSWMTSGFTSVFLDRILCPPCRERATLIRNAVIVVGGGPEAGAEPDTTIAVSFPSSGRVGPSLGPPNPDIP